MSTTVDLSPLTRLDREALADLGESTLIRDLLNLVERLVSENQTQRNELHQLRDEINRLKGEQAKPTFPPKGPPPGGTNYSSERERRQPRVWRKGTKLDQIRLDRVERVAVDRALLPPDAVYKGTEPVVIQDLILRTDNVRFDLEIWYSPSQGRSYRAVLPPGYSGEFGPGLKGLALALAFGANVSEGKLLELFRQAQVQVSSGWLALLLSGNVAGLAAEAQAAARTRLEWDRARSYTQALRKDLNEVLWPVGERHPDLEGAQRIEARWRRHHDALGRALEAMEVMGPEAGGDSTELDADDF